MTYPAIKWREYMRVQRAEFITDFLINSKESQDNKSREDLKNLGLSEDNIKYIMETVIGTRYISSEILKRKSKEDILSKIREVNKQEYDVDYKGTDKEKYAYKEILNYIKDNPMSYNQDTIDGVSKVITTGLGICSWASGNILVKTVLMNAYAPTAIGITMVGITQLLAKFARDNSEKKQMNSFADLMKEDLSGKDKLIDQFKNNDFGAHTDYRKLCSKMYQTLITGESLDRNLLVVKVSSNIFNVIEQLGVTVSKDEVDTASEVIVQAFKVNGGKSLKFRDSIINEAVGLLYDKVS